MPWAALAGYLLFAVLAFGVRGVVHYRRTGSSGFRGLASAGPVERLAGVGFFVTLVAGGLAPGLAIAGVAPWIIVPATRAVRVAAIVLYVVGVAVTLWAQFAMRDSWRVGVDPAERTELVMRGPFRWVRNPIFSAMLVAVAGLVLAVPNAVAVVAFVALLGAVELQVRAVEEPHLLRVHGEAYRTWARVTGRFVPGLGRLR